MEPNYPLHLPDFYIGDPAPAYRDLRHNSPVHWTSANGGFWGITRHDDIKFIGSRPQLFSSAKGVLMPDGKPRTVDPRPMLITTDPPRHKAMRQLISKGFTPRHINAMEPDVRAIVRGVLDSAKAGVELEYAEGFVAKVPVRIIADLLGAPAEDWERFRAWSDASVGSADPDVTLTSQEAFGALTAYFRQLIDLREQDRTNDLISILMEAEVDGERLSHDELMAFLHLLLVAGNETTRNLIALGTIALVNHPAQLRTLVEDPSLIPTAVEEMLRYVTPVTHMTRWATEDVELRGRTIRKGQAVVLLYGAANRDEDVFGDTAEQFDITRRPNPHLAFGTGEHACLGLSLARLEARVFFEEFLARFDRVELTGEVLRMRSTMVPGIRTMHVRLGSANERATVR
ncbi:cytochrome P450 [Actinophytocola glycyrrhizae]|uniref:Cytochrome P450 n=1 Tax=Actinophytocola glycyrrhizae TaxID=2044873 RepID=A0ABV9SA90_9PSEU